MQYRGILLPREKGVIQSSPIGFCLTISRLSLHRHVDGLRENIPHCLIHRNSSTSTKPAKLFMNNKEAFVMRRSIQFGACDAVQRAKIAVGIICSSDLMPRKKSHVVPRDVNRKLCM